MNAAGSDRTATILIDVGNTRIKLGWLEPLTGRRESAIIAVNHAERQPLVRWLEALPVVPVAAIGVNVASPAVGLALDALFKQRYGYRVKWHSSSLQDAGVHNNYESPEQLGADRWMAMLGLTRYHDASTRPMLLATFGTATTIDTLVPSPESDPALPQWLFAGGLILPGPQLMRASLSKGTARLPAAHGDVVPFPHNTHQAIISGIAAAQAGAVQRQWLAGLQRYGLPPRVFSSGGAWPQLGKEVQSLMSHALESHGYPDSPIQWLDAPVLDGLAQLIMHTK